MPPAKAPPALATAAPPARASDAHEPGDGGEQEAEQELEREFFKDPAGEGGDEGVESERRADPLGENVVHERDEGGENDEHRADIDGEFDPVGGTGEDRVEEVAVGLAGVDVERRVGGAGLGNQDFGDHQGGGHGDDGFGDEVGGEDELLGGVRAAEETDVGDEHTAGHGGHAADHHAENLRARHAGEVGLDHERGLGLADEHIRGGAECLGSGEAHGFCDDPGDGEDDLLQDAEIVECRGECRETDDRGEDRKSEDHPVLFFIQERAEEEAGTVAGEREEHDEERADAVDGPAHGRGVEDERGENELEKQADADHALTDGAAVFTEEDRDAGEDGDAEKPAENVQKGVG
jgi:hypothetical protein